MVELILAFAVFGICLLPILNMIPAGSGIIANSLDQRLATEVAKNALQSDQNDNVSDTPDYTSVPTWARTSTAEGGETFQIYTAEGWCASDTPPGNGSVSSSVPPSYHVIVKVGWDNNFTVHSTNHVVIDSTELGSLVDAPPVGQTVNSCPLGLA